MSLPRLTETTGYVALGRRVVTMRYELPRGQSTLSADTVERFITWSRWLLDAARRGPAPVRQRFYRLAFVRPPNPDIPGDMAGGIGTTFRPEPLIDLIQKLYMFMNQYDDIVDRDFTEAIVEVTTVPEDPSGRAGNRAVIFFDKWVLISPQSRSNCGFTAISISANYRRSSGLRLLTDVAAQTQSGKGLKRDCGLTNSDSVSGRELAHISHYLDRTIRVLNSQFRVGQLYGNGSREPVNLFFHHGHYWAAIECDNVQTHQPEALPILRDLWCARTILSPDDMEALQYELYNQNYAEFVLPKKPVGTFDRKIAAADFEAFHEGEFIPYACGLSYYEEGATAGADPTHVAFMGENCAEEFLQHLFDNREKFDGYTIYYHNGAKFDMQLLFKFAMNERSCPWKIRPSRFIVQEGAIIQTQLYCSKDASDETSDDDEDFLFEEVENGVREKEFQDGHFIINFLDSLRMLPGSLLQLTRDFNVKHKKLEDAIDHDSITRDNWMNQPNLIPYLRNDCNGLLEVMTSFANDVWESSQISITRCLTGATLAKKNFFQNFYEPKYTPIYHLKSSHDAFIRSSYFGGRVECFQLGIIEGDAQQVHDRIYKYDVTSEYPFVGCRSLPYGRPTVFTRDNIGRILNGAKNFLNDTFFGFVRVRLRGPFALRPWQLPGHAAISQQKLVFPIFQDWHEAVFFSEEMRCQRNRGYEYDFIDAIGFLASPFFKKTFEAAFAMKDAAAREGKPAKKNAAKVIANSTYGFTGLRTKARDQVLIRDLRDQNLYKLLDQKLAAGTVKCWSEHGRYGMVRSEEDLMIKDFNVAIAAAITSYARSYIREALEDFQNPKLAEDDARDELFRVYYCDTDSLATNRPMNRFGEETTAKNYLLDKYFWDGKGKALGTLKNECTEELEHHIMECIEHDPGCADWDKTLTKAYCAQLMKEELEAEPAHEFSFDSMIICGNKSYALRRHFMSARGMHEHMHWPPLEIHTLKGIRKRESIAAWRLTEDSDWISCAPDTKLTYEHYRIMARGGALLQNQTQFRAGNHFLLDPDYQGGSRIVTLPKAVRQHYDKGIVDSSTNQVSPLTLTQKDYDEQAHYTLPMFKNIDIDPRREPPKPSKPKTAQKRPRETQLASTEIQNFLDL
jgi:hypothetical protein